MTWNADGEVIKKAVDCGADYILAAPFAPADVFKRVRILINDRKPFIVTSDYIGPDRRRDLGRGDSSIPLIDVPNTLRTKANGEVVDLTELSAAVNDAMSEINDQRLVRHSYQINLLVEMIVPAYGKEEVAPVIVFMSRNWQRLPEVRSGSRVPVRACRRTLSEFERRRGFNQQRLAITNQKDIDLLKPLSQAVLTSFNPDQIQRYGRRLQTWSLILPVRSTPRLSSNSTESLRPRFSSCADHIFFRLTQSEWNWEVPIDFLGRLKFCRLDRCVPVRWSQLAKTSLSRYGRGRPCSTRALA